MKGGKLDIRKYLTKGMRAKAADAAKERKDAAVDVAKKTGNEKELKKLLKPDEYKDYEKEKRDKAIEKAKKTGDTKALDKLMTDTEKAQAKLDAAKKKEGEKETKADAAALDFKKDEDGIIVNKDDAAKYKSIAGKAPRGWKTDPDDESGKSVIPSAEPKKEPAPKKEPESEPDKKDEPKDDKGFKKTSTGSKKVYNSTDPKGDMIKEEVELDESPELQAIMSLDDEGIKADINRKGQVVVKKKDLKRAEKKLKKEFGGKFKTLLPKLVGESIQKQRTAWEVVSKARARIIEAVDAEAARELYLFMQNERSLMRQRDSIIKNISRKMKSGKYDHKQAPKLWMYWVDNGAKEYDKLYSSPGAKTFDKDTKMSVAIQLADEYKAEIELGNYS